MDSNPQSEERYSSDLPSVLPLLINDHRLIANMFNNVPIGQDNLVGL
jgi:hypothetical protein